ncbi:MAG: DUF2299 family protein [Nitrososphaeraceae archaeon]
MSASKPEKLLEAIKNWVKEDGKYNTEEVYNPKTHFTLSLFSKEQDSGELPISVAYPKDLNFTRTILIGWTWRPSDTDIKAYQSIKDINVKRDLIKSIKSKCNEKDLSISINPDEENLQEVRISKPLPLESLAKSEFVETVSKLVSMWAFLSLQFRFHNISRADFDPSKHI